MMSRPVLTLLSVGICLLGLAACGSDRDALATMNTVRNAATTLAKPITQRETPPTAPPRVTRAVLDTILSPVDLVTLENNGAQAVVGKIATNGDVETWSSVDNLRLSMREGVVLASRGFSDDLMSAQVPRLAQIKQTNTPYTRRYVTLTGDDQPVTQAFDCKTARVGGESITIVDLKFATQRITEACAGPTGSFTNDFWFEIGGKLRRSRQWVGEAVGFVVVEHLQ